ncbi:MAG: tetratricopeptide repeat protein [Deferribacteres bacterium]|nr:tetratricopeptide repeat protein [candidate division KSB1 bacterium]MCB9501842.1 tetratricopeptide repeat protein [Deferribacteres bacterium]
MRCTLFILVLNFAISYGKAQSLYDSHFPGKSSSGVSNAAAVGDISPVALLGNPAALALSRDAGFALVANTPFQLDFIGASKYFPQVGTFALGLSRFDLQLQNAFPDSQDANENVLERASLAFGRSLGSHFAFGLSMHANRWPRDDFGTATVSMMLFESRDEFASELYTHPHLYIHSLRNFQKYSLSLSYHDFSFDKKHLQGFAQLGFHYRIRPDMPFFYSTLRTNGHEERFDIGVGMAVNENFSFYTALEDEKNFAAGTSISFGRQVLSVGYTHGIRKFIAAFSLRISGSPFQSAKGYWEKGVSLSRRGSYKNALSEIQKYRYYNPDDEKGTQLEKWLLEKVQARDEKINSLLLQAEQYITEQKFIKADLCFIEILTIDKNNREAKEGLLQIREAVNFSVMKIVSVGKTAFESGNYAAAERAFYAIQQVRPENEEAKLYLRKLRDYYYGEAEKLFLRGLGYYNQKNYKMAVQSFQEALVLSREHNESVKYLEDARSKLDWQQGETTRILAQARQFVGKDEFKRASELYQNLLELDPQNQVAKKELRALKPKLNRYIDRLMVQGKNAFANGNYDTAKEYFEKAFAIDQSQQAQYYLGKIADIRRKRMENNFEKAEEAFAAKDWNKAINWYDAVLQQDNNYKEAREKRQQAYQNSDFDELLNSADTKLQSKNYLEAYELYTALLERDAENLHVRAQVDTCRLYLDEEVESLFNTGISYFAGEDYENAIRQWDAALRINPEHTKSKEYKKKAEQRLKALNRLPSK